MSNQTKEKHGTQETVVSIISLTTLNVNGLKDPIQTKQSRLSDWIKKQDFTMSYSYKIHFIFCHFLIFYYYVLTDKRYAYLRSMA